MPFDNLFDKCLQMVCRKWCVADSVSLMACCQMHSADGVPLMACRWWHAANAFCKWHAAK
jgi:hypothetical protein